MADETKVENMDWQNVRKILRDSKPNTRAIDPQEKALRDYYGEENFRELRELSARANETRGLLGNVVLLPGIMGSHLSVVDKDGDEDAVWFNFWRIVKGDLDRLKLNKDGKTNANSETVKATGLIGWYYARALETLQAEPFPYDWRLSVGGAADKLADFVKAKFKKGETVNFVAHSMGGLVVREFIFRYKSLWDDVKGKLVMLGTPNSGSFAAVQTLMGKNDVAAKLATIDLWHNSAEIFRIINTFFGMYQLCPSRLVNPEIYERTLWQTFTDVLFDDYLLQIPQFHQELFDDRVSTIDAARMTYIAGVGYETASGMQLSNGIYDFITTLDGDGTVPHKLGLLEGITTYYVEESHADLPNNRLVLESVKDILTSVNSTTARLTTIKPDIKRARSVRSIDNGDLQQAAIIAEIVRKEKNAAPTEISEARKVEPAIVHEAEKKVLRSILGGNLDFREEPVSYFKEETAEEENKTSHTVNIEVLSGNIVGVNAPVIAVGQYQNIPPSGSIGDIDTALDYWLTLSFLNGVIGTDLGQLFIVPLDGKKLHKDAKALIVGGMGQHVRFNRDSLRYLLMNITTAVLTLGYDRFATVLIGTSYRTISIERAIKSILSGISDALERKPTSDGKPMTLTLVLVENKLPRKEMLENTIQEIIKRQTDENEQTIAGLKVKLVEKPKTEISKAIVEKAKKRNKSQGDDFVRAYARKRKEDEKDLTRITIKRTPGLIELSALASSAAIPMREIPVQDFIVDSAIEKLRGARTFKEQDKYARLLHTILIPEEFQSLIDSNRSLVLILNRDAAAIPWEMVGYGSAKGMSNFGINLNLTRQFSSLSASMPGVAPPLNNMFKALVIADPAKEENLRLAGARIEGEQIRNLFVQLKDELKNQVDFQFETRIGYEQCDIVEILSLIADKEFDLVHFAGHGTFDPNNTAKSGWVFGKDEKTGNLKILTASEIFRLRQVPRLVFANACFSSELGTSEMCRNLPTGETNRILAGLAEAFFVRGIENYVGSGWQVDDIYATNFAKTFYVEALSNGKNIGEALSEARTVISSQAAAPVQINSTWGAYQHYGDSNTPLVR
ncbi:MAG: CHAT domain-containing protein [Pyrinomonadaceae bacterium]